MRTVIISQAHLSSQRLPGKVLLPMHHQPLIGWHIDQLQHVQHADTIVVATSDASVDNPLVDYCKSKKVDVFRGSDANVLSRFYYAAQAYRADVIVRVTSDCPLIDPTIIDQAIQIYQNQAMHLDYVSNLLPRTYPYGMEVEVFSMDILEQLYLTCQAPEEIEHVTYFIRREPLAFRIRNIDIDPHLSQGRDLTEARFTVDYQADFDLIEKLIEKLDSKPFSLASILTLMDEHPEWQHINAHCQKPQPELNRRYE